MNTSRGTRRRAGGSRRRFAQLELGCASRRRHATTQAAQVERVAYVRAMADLQPLPINARFVQKLQRMCDDPSSDALIAWSADGTKIHILDLEPFSQQLLPQYFKHNSFSSFIRQMNTYGFNKVDADGWTFAHPHFRRDDPEAMKLIKRRTGGGPARLAHACGAHGHVLRRPSRKLAPS